MQTHSMTRKRAGLSPVSDEDSTGSAPEAENSLSHPTSSAGIDLERLETEELPESSCPFGDALETLFSFLTFSDLKVCRQVCKAWNEEACRDLQYEISVVVDDNKLRKYPDLFPLLENGRKLKLPLLLNDLKVTVDSEKCFRFLHSLNQGEWPKMIRIFEIRVEHWANNPEDARTLLETLMKHGPNMWGLSFEKVIYDYLLSAGVQLSSLSLPELNNLEFQIEAGVSEEASIDFLVQIINLAPKLTFLDVWLFEIPPGSSTDMLKEILIRSNLMSVQDLYISCSYEIDILKLLKSLESFKCKELKSIIFLTCHPQRHRKVKINPVPALELMNVIARFSRTLVFIRWDFKFNKDFLMGSNFPYSPVLTLLDLFDFTFEIQFWRRVPSLKEFRCARLDFYLPSPSVTEVKQNQHSRLKVFRLERYGNVDSTSGSQILRAMFPNLDTLDDKEL